MARKPAVRKNPAADPAYAGLHWSIDPDTPIEDREEAHATAAAVANYLFPLNPETRQRSKRLPPKHFEVLLSNPQERMVYVRWPNGSMRWESEISLQARGFDIPKPVALTEPA